MRVTKRHVLFTVKLVRLCKRFISISKGKFRATLMLHSDTKLLFQAFTIGNAVYKLYTVDLVGFQQMNTLVDRIKTVWHKFDFVRLERTFI